jgi:hypothetical protein
MSLRNAAFIGTLLAALPTAGQGQSSTLFQGARVFDGTSARVTIERRQPASRGRRAGCRPHENTITATTSSRFTPTISFSIRPPPA